jgi:hypothetical protein
LVPASKPWRSVVPLESEAEHSFREWPLDDWLVVVRFSEVPLGEALPDETTWTETVSSPSDFELDQPSSLRA